MPHNSSLHESRNWCILYKELEKVYMVCLIEWSKKKLKDYYKDLEYMSKTK